MELPTESASKHLIAHYASVWQLLRPELAKPALVLPTARFFPDAFTPTRAGVSKLLARLQAHANISDIPVEVQVPGETSSQSSGCGTGACAPTATLSAENARIVDTGERWQINMLADEIRHPVALTTMLSRALGAIVLEEVRGAREVPRPAQVSGDLAAVQLGFGPLLLEGSYIYSKSCGGPSVASLTALGVSELGVAVALFAAQHGHRMGPAKRAASTTQRAALAQADELIATNRNILKQLGRSAESVAAKEFSLSAPKARWWGLFDKRAGADADLDQALLNSELDSFSPKRELPVQGKASPGPDDDLKRLVSESLSESRAG